jgi:hypothetical protein
VTAGEEIPAGDEKRIPAGGADPSSIWREQIRGSLR